MQASSPIPRRIERIRLRLSRFVPNPSFDRGQTLLDSPR